jgi:hypothetical protein
VLILNPAISTVFITLPFLTIFFIAAVIVGAVLGYRSRRNDDAHTIEKQRQELGRLRIEIERRIPPTATEEESDFLRRLPYADYLRSDYWRRVRWAILRDSELRCRICNAGGNLRVHHRNYSSIGKEKISDLICVCDDCHQLFHNNKVLVKEYHYDSVKEIAQKSIDRYLEAEAVVEDQKSASRQDGCPCSDVVEFQSSLNGGHR